MHELLSPHEMHPWTEQSTPGGRPIQGAERLSHTLVPRRGPDLGIPAAGSDGDELHLRHVPQVVE